jgi:LmbE family N-acetylglucosaminyl deacetylase
MAHGGAGAETGPAMNALAMNPPAINAPAMNPIAGNPIAGRVLILAPHPDDEIVACGITASRAIASGARVFVLHLTTGVPPEAAQWRWRRPRYPELVWRRQEEALRASRLLGAEIVGFRETAARRLRFDLDAACADIAAAIARCRAEAVWVPAFEGAHQDHSTANALAGSIAGAVPVWEFAAYNFAGGRVRSNGFADDRGGEIAICATTVEAAAKRTVLACYASERRNLRHIVAGREACRPLPVHDYARPPHPGILFRERFHWVPFRHPGVDFDPSAEIYRDLASWASARLLRPSAALDDGPGGETRQPDREFAGALDETERQRVIGRQSGDRG